MMISNSTSTIDVQNKHVTIRGFLGKDVSAEMVTTILGAARRAPTSSNYQTYSVVVVRNPDTKKKLAVLAGNQKHVETCPVFFAFCADISRLAVACEMHEKELVRGFETTLVSSVDAALVGMSANTAAESLGLGAVMIGGMRNQPEQVAKALGLPDGVYVVFGMCLGWPNEEARPAQKPRLADDLVVHYESYNVSGQSEKLAAYDRALADHYNARGNNLDDAAWTGPLSNQLSEARRTNLRPELERLGFSFD
ncbi:MAG: nitroreductase [Cellvibrionaceae bacterium]|jgi:nitroreductase